MTAFFFFGACAAEEEPGATQESSETAIPSDAGGSEDPSDAGNEAESNDAGNEEEPNDAGNEEETEDAGNEEKCIEGTGPDDTQLFGYYDAYCGTPNHIGIGASSFDENLEAILVLDACNDYGSTQDEIKDALGLTEEQFEELMDLVDLQNYKGPDVCQEILNQSYATCDEPEMQSACCATCTSP